MSTASMAFRGVLGYLPPAQVDPAQAALSVALPIESMAFMPGMAYGMAATPLVGQNLGAGKPDRAAHAAWVATGQAVFIMTLVAIFFLSAPGYLARTFTKDPKVVGLVIWYLRINALSEPMLALSMVLRGALQGAGETRAPMFFTIATLWLVRMPLAILLTLTLKYGAVGSWIAMSVTTALSGILMAWWFVRGSWRTVSV
jgi:multidrug resistance protein, MATE family